MSLRSQVMRGGVYLALRQGLGMVISLGGVLLLTRTIGPDQYGIYTAVYSLFWYLQTISQLGISVYLVRREGQEEQKFIYDQGFTLLLLMALSAVAIAFVGLPWIGQWVRLESFQPVARTMLFTLPLVLVGQVGMAQLERKLDYRRVALIELANQLMFYLVGLGCAFQGMGVWAPVAGWWAQQAQSVILLLWAARYRPQFHWDPKLIREMLGYSVGFSASYWIWQARVLVNPLIVGRYAGADAVGYIALAIRMVEVLGFVKGVTWRISIAALARLQDDTERLRKAVNEGMGLQILAIGPLLVVLAIALPYLLPVMFGPEWLPVLSVFPFIALSSLSNSLFNMHSSVLYVLKHNWHVSLFHLANIVLFGGAAAVLVPRLGLVGYGWAEMVTLLSYCVIHYSLSKAVGSPDYRLAGVWWAGLSLGLFVYQLGWWTLIAVGAIALLPQTHRQIKAYIHSLRSSKA
ncbi:oligosaccharide flippase family protein [Geitlerinema sp. PCC 7407]|uniref:oligosaccharide flippase family protein n=1 Tax=Geitlerinema sp. PCC 7407 TaxID=1173025 RepID=UPI00029FB0D8|nr:oligosaccharide flippase family protein [Geitlerinema sp. PCC 7407]AFY66517.1 polysaccharide biosynthesis protein [Geitlerinema sp. PCC 7407]